MHINLIKPNMTVINFEIEDVAVLYSYHTPVAYHDKDGIKITDKKYSNTTTKHINEFIDGRPSKVTTQKDIDNKVNY